MRIGELARRTGASTRVLRYYEQQGLVTPARAANTYREYDEEQVAQVERVARMVRSGIPTRLIRELLDLEAAQARGDQDACPRELAQLLAAELTEVDARIECLTGSRRAILEALARTEHAALASEARAGASVS